MDTKQAQKSLVFSSDKVSGRDTNGSSLIPMLIAGLILVSLGYAGVMIFV